MRHPFIALVLMALLVVTHSFGGFGARTKKKKTAAAVDTDDEDLAALGPNAVYARADALFAASDFERSAQAYWAALMKAGQAEASDAAAYTVEQAFAGVRWAA